jgi:hydrogenase maturation protease
MIEPQPFDDVWAELARAAPERVLIGGVFVRRGSRVRLHPRAGGDIFDQALAGRTAMVEGLDESMEGTIHVTVTLDDDPGRDLGDDRYLGHRFFFSAEEVEPLDKAGEELPSPVRILVAGIGNVFLGDDGFGVAVAQRLAERPVPPGVDVRDFGIRGMDLAYAMQQPYDVVVMIDAAPRGHAPGTVSVIDAAVDADGPVAIDTHGMDPVKVLALARAIGRVPPRVLVVACEPERVISGDDWAEMEMRLTPSVDAAVGDAATLVEQLIRELQSPESQRLSDQNEVGHHATHGADRPPLPE